MSVLIACLSTGKGTWASVLELAMNSVFEQVYLVCNPWTQQNFKTSQHNISLVVVDDQQPLPFLITTLQQALKGKISDTEVALNLFSGTGKEHMALLAALLKLGLGVRLVVSVDQQLQEI
ncbi:MAG TPA: hypothetical protein VJG90_09145 [Candidatus Nanoarchaeia archaeon]|nr:hypothetical protein [Candidatus Nanoarchaeia archaeon]